MLTDRQRQSLHSSIIEYLTNIPTLDSSIIASLNEGLEKSLKTDDISITTPPPPPNTQKPTLLEKKWTSVVRLQRKVLELETALSASTSASSASDASASRTGGLAASKDGRWLPVLDPPPKVGKGHRGGGINKVAVHPIFELAATAGEDGTVKLWDLESGDFAKTLKGRTAGVQCVVWSGAGDLLVSCGADLSVKVWDAGDGYACRRTMRGHGHNVCAAAFCRLEGVQDKGVATTGRDGTIRIWDLKTGFCVHTIRARAEPPVWLRDLQVRTS